MIDYGENVDVNLLTVLTYLICVIQNSFNLISCEKCVVDRIK